MTFAEVMLILAFPIMFGTIFIAGYVDHNKPINKDTYR